MVGRRCLECQGLEIRGRPFGSRSRAGWHPARPQERRTKRTNAMNARFPSLKEEKTSLAFSESIMRAFAQQLKVPRQIPSAGSAVRERPLHHTQPLLRLQRTMEIKPCSSSWLLGTGRRSRQDRPPTTPRSSSTPGRAPGPSRSSSFIPTARSATRTSSTSANIHRQNVSS